MTVRVRVWHSAAAALAAGEELVAVDGREAVALAVGQRLVPLEAMDDVAEELPQGPAVHQGIDAADGVDAGGLGADEAPQPRGDAEVLLQAVEAAAAGGEEGEGPGEGRRGRDAEDGSGSRSGWGSRSESRKTFSA